MAIAQAVANVFKQELLKGKHDFDGGATYKISLYTSSATLGAATANYAATATDNQVANGNGYATAGNALQNPTVVLSGTVAYADFDNISWPNATFSAAGGLMYRSDGSAPTNNAVAVLSFGGTFTATNGTFTIQFPTAGGGSEILRLT